VRVFDLFNCQSTGFELEFPESVKIVREQGYLWQLMNLDVMNAGMSGQLKTLRVEMERAWEDT